MADVNPDVRNSDEAGKNCHTCAKFCESELTCSEIRVSNFFGRVLHVPAASNLVCNFYLSDKRDVNVIYNRETYTEPGPKD